MKAFVFSALLALSAGAQAGEYQDANTVLQFCEEQQAHGEKLFDMFQRRDAAAAKATHDYWIAKVQANDGTILQWIFEEINANRIDFSKTPQSFGRTVYAKCMDNAVRIIRAARQGQRLPLERLD